MYNTISGGFDSSVGSTPPSVHSSPGNLQSKTHRKLRTSSFDGFRNQLTRESSEGSHSHTHSHSASHHSSAPLDIRYGSTAQDPYHGNSPFSVKMQMQNQGSDEEMLPLKSTFSLNEQKSIQEKGTESDSKSSILYYFLYALLNTTMSVPSLYGYASVIFNHEAFQSHIASLSKLVIWSSAVHQLVFVLFSTLSFAKAEVQDAGLLFLSCMTNHIATSITDEGGSLQEILSTSIVTLGIATASLGIVLMFFGKFNMAQAVSYLPLPVVGGYLGKFLS